MNTQKIEVKDVGSVAKVLEGAGAAMAAPFTPPPAPKKSDAEIDVLVKATEAKIVQIVEGLGSPSLPLMSKHMFKERKTVSGLEETAMHKKALAKRAFQAGDNERANLYVFWVWQLECRAAALKAGTRLIHSEFKGVREMLGAPDEKFVTYLPEDHKAFPVVVKEEKVVAPKLELVKEEAAPEPFLPVGEEKKEEQRMAANQKGRTDKK